MIFSEKNYPVYFQDPTVNRLILFGSYKQILCCFEIKLYNVCLQNQQNTSRLDAHLNRSKNCLSLCSISSINSFHPIKIKAVRMVLKSIFRYSIILFLNKLSDTNSYLCTILHIMTSMRSAKYLILTYQHFLNIN